MATGGIYYTPKEALTSADVVDHAQSTAKDLPGSANQIRLANERINQLSNPNLLINPDFKINQRGQTEYTGAIYNVDRWHSKHEKVLCEITNNGLKISSQDAFNNPVVLCQRFETPLSHGAYTLSVYVNEMSGIWRIKQGSEIISKVGLNVFHFEVASAYKDDSVYIWRGDSNESSYINIGWMKLETGSIATPFIPPDSATELMNCKRYYQNIEAFYAPIFDDTKYWCGIGRTDFVEMRTIPTARIKSILKVTGDDISDRVIVGNIHVKKDCIPVMEISYSGFDYDAIRNAIPLISYSLDAEIY